MKIKFLLLGISLPFLPTLSLAQCIATQDCTTLGYTETSCNGKGLKCPFGNGWFCSGDESTVCTENGFKYTCTGTEYSGGNGNSCGGKYTSCTCAAGYEWKDESCTKKITDGATENYYYCNGQIAGTRTPDMNFFVSVQNQEENTGDELMAWSMANLKSTNAFCGKGRLPTKDELIIIYNHKSTINSLSTAAGGQNLKNEYYWASDFQKNNGLNYYYVVNMSNAYMCTFTYYNAYVRPVLDL